MSVHPSVSASEWRALSKQPSPGEVDLDPDVLDGRHEPASGVRIERRMVREHSSAAHP
jgi:hypothetical protein